MSHRSVICYTCKQQGHIARDCPSGIGRSKKKNEKCCKCDKYGHHANECPGSVDSNRYDGGGSGGLRSGNDSRSSHRADGVDKNLNRRYFDSSINSGALRSGNDSRSSYRADGVDKNPNRRYFDSLINGNNKIATADDAFRFFQGAINFVDPLDMLYLLTDPSKRGLETLKRACSLGCDATIVNDGLIRFLSKLGEESLNQGTGKSCTNQCFMSAYETPGLIDCLHDLIEKNVIVDIAAIAWFITAVARSSNEVRESERLHKIAKLLLRSECEASKLLATLLCSTDRESKAAAHLSTLKDISSLDGLRAFQPQHDNDFPFDYRKISIIPTPSELNCPASSVCVASSFLMNSSADIDCIPAGDGEGLQMAKAKREATILDRDFRLLREDMIGPMKEEFHKEVKTKECDRRKLFSSPLIVGMDIKPKPCVLVQVRMPAVIEGRVRKMSKKERSNFFEEGGRKVLSRDAVLLFANGDKVIHVGVVVGRERIGHDSRTLTVGVSFFGNDSLVQALSVMNDGDGKHYTSHAKPLSSFVYQASSSLFSYSPILKRLQSMVSVPFPSIVAHFGLPTSLPISLDDDVTSQVRRLDPSQQAAVTFALNNNLALIQGPPGTGKTVVGVEIAQSIIRSNKAKTKEVDRILVLSYTNHALDDFLESLVRDGVNISTIVRFGSSPKISDLIKQCCLDKSDETTFTRAQASRYAALKGEQESLHRDIEKLKGRGYTVKRQWGPKWWNTASVFLQQNYPDVEKQLTFNTGTSNSDIKIVGRKGKAAGEDQNWIRWCEGRNKLSVDTAVDGETKSEGSIWNFNKSQRREKLEEWENEWRKEHLNELSYLMHRYDLVEEEIRTLRDQSKLAALQRATIIAGTTTSTAKNMDLIAAAKPTVVIIEEAAEILECDILSALPSSVNRLILIGDHLQLRPKLEHYPLRTESGKGINFDISLLERLASIDGFPLLQLNVQHRMRPEISSIIRNNTYPALRDHESVNGRADIKGVQSNVVFISHDEEETGENDSDITSTSSKTNMHEVNMVIAIVNHMTMQGYSLDDMTILTPYLGQLVLIQKHLVKRRIGVDINDIDRSELKKADFELEHDSSNNSDNKKKDSPNNKNSNSSNNNTDDNDATETDGEKKVTVKSKLRVATIDNFQGEEARIIIGSMVRSNSAGTIGFLQGKERINVLCSRARDGFFLIGNADTLRNCSSTKGQVVWGNVLDSFGKVGLITNGFPIKCQNHGTEMLLKKSEDFHTMSPDGGCDAGCDALLPNCPLQHKCHLKCHKMMDSRGFDVHLTIACLMKLQVQCPNGHPLSRLCSEVSPQCQMELSHACPKGHIHAYRCSAGVPSSCFTCVAIEEEKLERIKISIELAKTLNQKLLNMQQRCAEAKAKLDEEKVLEEHQLLMTRAELEEELVLKEIIKIRASRMLQLNKNNNVSSKDASTGVVHLLGVVPKIGVDITNRDEVDINVENNAVEATKDKENRKEVLSLNSLLATPVLASLNTPAVDGNHITELISIIDNSVISITSTNSDVSTSSPLTSTLSSTNSNAAAEGINIDLNRMKSIFKMVESKSWIKVHEMAAALIKMLETKDTDSYLHLLSLAVSYLSRVNLDESPSIMLKTISEMRDSVETFNLVDGSNLQKSFIAAVIYYLSAIVEAKLGDAPLITSSYAQSFLSICSSFDFPLMPSEWSEDANRIIKNCKAAPRKITSKTSGGAARQWQIMKQDYADNEYKSIGKLMSLVGIESIKTEFLNQFHRVKLASEQGLSKDGSSFNVRCDGNPGTGKTTCAKLYGELLIELEILPKDSIVHITSGSELLNGGVGDLKKILENVKKAGGGCIFIDESYQLSPQDDKTGRSILDFILVHSEKLESIYGPLVWIFAGYKKHMDKLFEHNPGLPSRFPIQFTFEDFTDDELLGIFNNYLLNKVEDKQEKKKEVKSAAAISIPIPRNNIDEWGNTWNWDGTRSTYTDSYGNISGYGPGDQTRRLGTDFNPIISTKDNSSWTYNPRTKMFKSNTGEEREAYPSKNVKKLMKVSPNPFIVSDEKWSRIAIRRLGKQRGRVGFGNARAVRILFDLVKKRQASRITLLRSMDARPDLFRLERDDLLGPKANRENLEACSAWKELQTLEGLTEVKKSMQNLIDMVIANADREECEKEMLEVSLNTVFLGNPGTGKTTVAKLYARILTDLGLLSKGEVIIKNPSDFVGSVLGKSESQTRAILEQGAGNVLVIDEFYSLNPSVGIGAGGDPYKTGVIDTIVEQVQGTVGDDRAVILIGYRKQMEAMFAVVNPGLSRRFQLENAFEFSDYDNEAFARILRNSCKKSALKIELTTVIFAVNQLNKAKALPNFGNVGALNNLLSKAKIRMQARKNHMDELLEIDFHDGTDKGDVNNIFADIIGGENILKKLKEIQDTIKFANKKGVDAKENVNFNYIFTGSPGTGKTTIARRMGQMYHDLGLLPMNDVIECGASDFITGYVGQSGKKTYDMFTKARGKTLFIDEAYLLNPERGGNFMQEAVDEMVKCLTLPEFKGQMLVILAGYDAEIEQMLKCNQGLKSRFAEKLYFEDFKVADVEKMLEMKLKEKDLELSVNAKSYLSNLCTKMMEAVQFGNGRDVIAMVQFIYVAYAQRIGDLDDDAINTEKVSTADMAIALKKYLDNKASTPEKASDDSKHRDKRTFATQTQNAAPASAFKMDIDITAAEKEVEKKIEEEEKEINDKAAVDPFLVLLQDILDEEGWNTKDGVLRLASLSVDDNEIKDLAKQIAAKLNISFDEAQKKLMEWKQNQEDVQEKMKQQEEEMEKAKLENRKALVPIWRCGVCGRADVPWIACYVAPFIVRYEERLLSECKYGGG